MANTLHLCATVCTLTRGSNRSQLHTNALMVKTAAISVRVPDDMKEQLERAAAEDRRSLASLVEKILAEWLSERGADAHPAKRPKNRS